MSFKSASGFDRDKAMQANGFAASDMETDGFTYSAEEQRAARIPSAVDAQIYEFRRMYRM